MAVLEKDLQQYTTAWYEKMIQIWQDRILAMGIHDTGALLASVRGSGLQFKNTGSVLSFQFLLYGIYVDMGVGNGYRPGEDGKIHVLDPIYRIENKLGQKREERPWFSRSWYISTQVMKAYMARIIGEGFARLFDSLTTHQ